MTQNIEHFLTAFEMEQGKALKEIKARAKIENSNRKPRGEWMAKVVDKIRISELADELGVDSCPECNYGFSFDDSQGLFICLKAKYSGKQDCNVSGNIVKFMEAFG